MADRNQLKVADRHGIAEDDPFAELTRIMGFDPREPVRPQPSVHAVSAEAPDDAFDIDLEKELMGEFAGFDDEPAVAAPVDIEPPALEEAQAPQAEWIAAPSDEAEPTAEHDLDLHTAMDEEVAAALDQDFSVEAEAEPVADHRAYAEPVAEHEAYAEPVAEHEAYAEPVAEYEAYAEPEAVETLDEAVEQAPAHESGFDDFATGTFAAEPQHAETAEDTVYAAAPEAPAPVRGASRDDFATYFDGAMADVDMDFAARPVESEAMSSSTHDEVVRLDDALAAVNEEPAEFTAEPVFEDVAEQPVFQEAELPQLVSSYTDDQPAVHAPEAQDVEFGAAFDAAFTSDLTDETAQPVATAQSSALHENTLEDELNALLSRMTARPAVSEPAFVPASEVQVQQAELTVAHEDHDAHDAEALDAALLADLQALDLGDIAADTQEPQPAEDSAYAGESNWTWSRGTPLAPPAAASYAAASSYTAASSYAPASSYALEPSAPEPAPAPEPARYEMARYEMAQQPYTQAAAPVAAPRAEMPDIETVDVPERVVALADDLDLPELSFEQDQPGPVSYDDLDAEFSGLMGSMAAAEPEPAAPRATTYDDDPYVGFSQDRTGGHDYAAAAAASAGGMAADFDQAGFADSRPRGAREALAADELDYDPNLDEVNTVPDIAVGAARPRNRTFLAAAVVGAVAIVGGIGAFALSPGGNGSDAPVIVKADNQPIKVKPENPGGTVIPNQDNKVYEAVNGIKAADPKQQKLVTDAEEPVDVKQPASGQPESRVVDLSPADNAGTAAPTPKSEDRIEQAAAPEADAGNQETALVTPRKVRTMVVKPDGSLVPREEQAPAKVAAAEPADPAPQHVEVSGDKTGAVPPAAASDQPAAAEGTAKAQSSATPAVAPIAPQRPSDQPVDIVGEVKPDQVASLDQGAGAAGSWSMQIASQPTAESAQASYQDLSRRYASVLDGHTANIVKAEIAGKGTFYRVRVPTGSRNDAIKLCESYKAAGGNCFVSK